MTAKLDYRWHLRQVMATRGMFATTTWSGRWRSGGSGCPQARFTGW